MSNKENYLTKTWVVFLLAMLCCLFWGSAFPSLKIGYQLFEIDGSNSGTLILFAGVRFTLAGILITFFNSISHKKLITPKKSDWGKIVTFSLCQTVVLYFFYYIGMAHTTSVKATILQAANVFLGILMAGYLFRQEKVTSRKLLGCLIGFAGVVLINLNGLEISFNLKGDGFILISAVLSSLANILLKAYSKDVNPAVLISYQYIVGGIAMIVGGIVLGGKLEVVTTAGVLLLFYMALISCIAQTLWGILLQHNEVSKVTVFGLMNPIFGVLLSTLLLDESTTFGITGVVALLLVCTGIFVVNKPAKKSV